MSTFKLHTDPYEIHADVATREIHIVMRIPEQDVFEVLAIGVSQVDALVADIQAAQAQIVAHGIAHRDHEVSPPKNVDAQLSSRGLFEPRLPPSSDELPRAARPPRYEPQLPAELLARLRKLFAREEVPPASPTQWQDPVLENRREQEVSLDAARDTADHSIQQLRRVPLGQIPSLGATLCITPRLMSLLWQSFASTPVHDVARLTAIALAVASAAARLPDTLHDSDSRALAEAFLANVLQIRGEDLLAHAATRRARAFAEAGTGDPDVRERIGSQLELGS